MFHSVRARLTLWYTAILALVLITFSAITYVFLARTIRAATDDYLRDTASELATGFLPADNTEEREDINALRFRDQEILLLDHDGRIVASSNHLMSDLERERMRGLAKKVGSGFFTLQGGREGDGIRVCVLPIAHDPQQQRLVVAIELDKQANGMEYVSHAMFIGIPIALIVAAAGGYLLARKSLAPVTTMSQKARQISAETLTDRIEVGNERDELGFLAATLNDLLERLRRAFESQRHFMAEASHELRTPLAIIQGEADVALSRRDRPAEEYRESLEVVQRSSRKLTHIVENVFLLARTDAGPYPVRAERLYLDEIVGECVREMRTIAASKEITLTYQTEGELAIAGDGELLHRLFLNLISNAIKFTPNRGTVTLDVRRESALAVVRISDTAGGIPLDDQQQIFERFFRSGEHRRGGGAGLGLPIARWIAEAHHGSLTLEKSGAEGSTFLVSLPYFEM